MADGAQNKARSTAVKQLFAYFYQLRHQRPPYAWEATMGEAMANGELKVIRPLQSSLLRTIQAVAEDVRLALDIPSLSLVADNELTQD